MNTITLNDPGKFLACQTIGCNQPVKDASLSVKERDAVLTYQCAGNHTSTLEMRLAKPTSSGQRITHKDRFESKTLRTKVVGVSFANPDGTERQSLLRCVGPGDTLTIERSQAPNGGHMLLLRHKIGVIGVLKTSILREFSNLYPDALVIARIVQLTGGTEQKATLGCNIVLAAAPDGEGQCVDEILGPSTEPSQRHNLVPDKTVYLDQKRSVFHCDARCSGMKGAIPMELRNALYHYHARPCRKCGAEKLVQCLGWKPV